MFHFLDSQKAEYKYRRIKFSRSISSTNSQNKILKIANHKNLKKNK